jgi:predicted  nucleic acid-binding Zn-ribbon protein
MRTISFARQVTLGFVLAVLLVAPNQVQAQWTVYDPAAYAQHLAEYLKEAERWIERVNQFTQEYQKLVEQLTTMKGVLSKAEELVGMNRQTIATLASIGRTVRGVFQLKNMIESMVRVKIRALKRIKDRLNNGLFDPDQDWQDFEEYLRDSIGRSAQDTVANSERLAAMDNEYDRLRTDLQIARERLARANEDLAKNLQWLKEETERDPAIQSAEAIESYKRTIENLRALIVALQSEITRLESEIEKKVRKYGIRLEAEENFGQEIDGTTKAWREATNVKEEILRKIDEDYWKGYSTEPQ